MELINKENLLPVSLEELAEFVLVGRPKLDMVRAGIRAIDKLGVADGVRKQKIEEAQMLAEALLDAEVRIGYLFGRMAKAKPGPEKIRDSGVPQPKETKEAAIERIGFNKKQAQRFEALAANPDIVEEVKQEARENDDLATRSAATCSRSALSRKAESGHKLSSGKYSSRRGTGRQASSTRTSATPTKSHYTPRNWPFSRPQN